MRVGEWQEGLPVATRLCRASLNEDEETCALWDVRSERAADVSGMTSMGAKRPFNRLACEVRSPPRRDIRIGLLHQITRWIGLAWHRVQNPWLLQVPNSTEVGSNPCIRDRRSLD